MSLKTFIPLAAPLSVDSYLRDVRRKFLPKQTWLGVRNRYYKNTINQIESDLASTGVMNKQLAEYISVSSILHCFDGWAHFSRGVESLMGGDLGSAIHMVYYAELRATMSFLAREGVGVFNNKHFIIDQSKSISLITGLAQRSRTHVFVPDAIEAWAKEQKNSQVLFDSLKIQGKTFSQWFDAAGKASSSAVSTKLAHDWLKNWSLDLTYISGDHVLRNEMSYRPHELSFNYNEKHFPDVINRIIDIWKTCEPAGSGKSSERFSILDYHLLRIAMEDLYKSLGNKLQDGKLNKIFLEKLFQNLNLSSSINLFKFLLRETTPDDLTLFQYAKHKTLKSILGIGSQLKYNRIEEHYSLDDVLAIMARALLLLRFSTAMISSLLEKAKISRNDIQFWLNKVGENFGLWDKTTQPNDLSELWEELSSSIASIESEIATGTYSSLANANNKSIMSDFAKIKQFQRACLWGLGI
jgi:hypothetical protein